MKEKDVLDYVKTDLDELSSSRDYKNSDTYKKCRSICF